jgi:methylenetetrahydrofolate dehydrogenase (NADP+)/methenyltetrahydrofolate cyclohydrolase
MLLLEHYRIELKGRKAVVLGRSNLVGKPMGLMLLKEHATVTYCHSRTVDLGAELRQADILVAAAGRAGIVTAEMVKPGAVVIDVGTNFVPLLDDAGMPVIDDQGQPKLKLAGDVDYAAVEQVAGYISPVPGGVGPMTIASVLSNVLALYRLRLQG